MGSGPLSNEQRFLLSNHGIYRSIYILTSTAPPLRSEPQLAAVGDVLGTVVVDVSIVYILSAGIPRAVLATYNIKEVEVSSDIITYFNNKQM